VENRLHWRLDVVMNEDQDRSRLGHAPENLAVLRHMALNVMQKDGTKGSLRGKFKRAGWENAYLAKLIALYPVHARIRKSVGSMIRKLSVTSSQ
jgi:hypothetical protein